MSSIQGPFLFRLNDKYLYVNESNILSFRSDFLINQYSEFWLEQHDENFAIFIKNEGVNYYIYKNGDFFEITNSNKFYFVNIYNIEDTVANTLYSHPTKEVKNDNIYLFKFHDSDNWLFGDDFLRLGPDMDGYTPLVYGNQNLYKFIAIYPKEIFESGPYILSCQGKYLYVDQLNNLIFDETYYTYFWFDFFYDTIAIYIKNENTKYYVQKINDTFQISGTIPNAIANIFDSSVVIPNVPLFPPLQVNKNFYLRYHGSNNWFYNDNNILKIGWNMGDYSPKHYADGYLYEIGINNEPAQKVNREVVVSTSLDKFKNLMFSWQNINNQLILTAGDYFNGQFNPRLNLTGNKLSKSESCFDLSFAINIKFNELLPISNKILSIKNLTDDFKILRIGASFFLLSPESSSRPNCKIIKKYICQFKKFITCNQKRCDMLLPSHKY